MKKIQEATHKHKRAGAVVVLQSTAELAQIVTVTGGDTFWVKVADLTPRGSGPETGQGIARNARLTDKP